MKGQKFGGRTKGTPNKDKPLKVFLREHSTDYFTPCILAYGMDEYEKIQPYLKPEKLYSQYELDLLYINPDRHSRGIGQQVWRMIEEKYPETKVWETHTPYFEKRNIHFYVNKCGFHIVEFYNPHHPEPHGPCDTPGGEYFFRFEKVMK